MKTLDGVHFGIAELKTSWQAVVDLVSDIILCQNAFEGKRGGWDFLTVWYVGTASSRTTYNRRKKGWSNRDPIDINVDSCRCC